MTISVVPVVENGSLIVRGKVVLNQVPHNINVTPVSHEAAFIGASSDYSSSHLVFSLGVLKWVLFLCSFKCLTFLRKVYNEIF